MVEQLSGYMAREGYQRVLTNVPGIIFLFRQEMQSTNVILTIEYSRGVYVSADQFKLLKQQMRDVFIQKGAGELHIMSLIIAENTEALRKMCEEEQFCWMIDRRNHSLIIYEHQVADFYGLKGKLEEFLSGYAQSGAAWNAAPQRGMPYGGGSRSGTFGGAQQRGAYSGMPQDGGEYAPPEKRSIGEILRSLPWITALLVAANVIVYFLCTSGWDLLYNKGDLAGRAVVDGGEYYRIYTSMFLHAGVSHLGSNMLVLYFLGEIIERYLGRIRYFLLYFLSGTGAAAASIWYQYHTHRFAASVGASGAVYGVLGALLWLVVAGRGRFQDVTLTRMLFFIVYSIYSGFTATNIDNAAHVGGLVCGFLLTALLTVRKKGTDRT